jgi:hypothetical protein
MLPPGQQHTHLGIPPPKFAASFAYCDLPWRTSGLLFKRTVKSIPKPFVGASDGSPIFSPPKCTAARRSAFNAKSSPERFIPIVTSGRLNGVDPGEIKGVLRDLKLTHSDTTEFVLGQEFRSVRLQKGQQPVAATSLFSGSLLRQLLTSALRHDYSCV